MVQLYFFHQILDRGCFCDNNFKGPSFIGLNRFFKCYVVKLTFLFSYWALYNFQANVSFFTNQVGMLWSFWMYALLQYPEILLFSINAFYPTWERIFIGTNQYLHSSLFALGSYIRWNQLFWSYAIRLLLK